MTDPRQDALLAQWLDDPSAGPPQGLEDEVVEAMVALRPELAPAPTLSLDDILAGVTEGPFARRSEAPVSISDEELDARRSEMPVSQAEVIDLAAARRRRNRIWGGVGAMAAAALVLFTILPEGEQFESAEVKAPAPPQQVLAPERELEQEGVNPAQDLALDAPEAPQEAKARTAETTPSPKPALKAAEDPSSYGPAPELLASADPEPSDDYADLEEDLGTWDVEDAPTTASKSAPSSMGAEDDVELAELQAERGGRAPKKESRRDEGRTRSPTAGSGGLLGDRVDNTSTPSAPSMEPVEETVADADFDESEFSEPEIPSDLDGLRASAAPRDYDSNWYLRALDGSDLDAFSAAVDLSTARASTGDYAGAAKACAALATSSDPRVAQDMAWRAARYQVMAGDSGALITVRAGQKRSSANTAFRANLYQLEGSILESRGDIEGAKAAYRTAANLNAAR